MRVPPPLPWKVRSAPERLILVFIAASVFVGAVLVLANASGLALPTCVWKRATGLPCAGCGGTRAACLLLHGRFGDALAMNPAAVLAVILAVLLSVYSVAVLTFRAEPLRLPLIPAKAWRLALVAGLGANWIYLLLAGRV